MSRYKQKLSAVVITYNEEKHIEKCLEGLSMVADEIIVVDSYSNDKTAKLCQNYMVRFFEHTYEGQIEQKQFALSLARHDMIIALDGDEGLSEDLIETILMEKENGFPYSGYLLNRKSLYCGKWIKHGDWYPDWKLRIWNKNEGIWGGINPHDKVSLKVGKPKKLKGDLLHYTFESRPEHKKQSLNYASISARSHYEAGKKGGIAKMIFSPIFYLIKNYIFKLGFLDGKLGWYITEESLKGKWLKYKFLRKLNSGESID